MARLTLVPPTEAPRDKKTERIGRIKRDAPESLLQCPLRTCLSTSVIPEKTGMRIKNGKPVGGTTVLICAVCLKEGRRTVVWP